jgi:hypothetical protein
MAEQSESKRQDPSRNDCVICIRFQLCKSKLISYWAAAAGVCTRAPTAPPPMAPRPGRAPAGCSGCHCHWPPRPTMGTASDPPPPPPPSRPPGSPPHRRVLLASTSQRGRTMRMRTRKSGRRGRRGGGDRQNGTRARRPRGVEARRREHRERVDWWCAVPLPRRPAVDREERSKIWGGEGKRSRRYAVRPPIWEGE